jgi:selenocysteine lyase/cysteine desulfurase
VQNQVHRLKEDASRFEDGTPDFLSLAALPAGFDLLESIGMDRINARSKELSAYLISSLAVLRYDSGTAMVRLYGPDQCGPRGGTVAFNLLTDSGGIIHYAAFESFAAARRIALRGGCFCNPGAAENAFVFDATRARACMDSASQDGFTVRKFAHCMGESAVGAVRASVGIPTLSSDIDALISATVDFCLASRKGSLLTATT